jgi:hypothetical protein
LINEEGKRKDKREHLKESMYMGVRRKKENLRAKGGRERTHF